jgi:hypothetical protein
MKAHELLSSPDNWCQESLAEDAHGNKVRLFIPQQLSGARLPQSKRSIPL